MPSIEKTPVLKELTPELAADLVFESFRFSQGDDFLQKEFIDLLGELNPHWKRTPEIEKMLKGDELLERANTFSRGKGHNRGMATTLVRDPEIARPSTRTILDAQGIEPFLAMLDKPGRKLSAISEMRVIRGIIERDGHFMHLLGFRNRSDDKEPRDFSYARTFLLNANITHPCKPIRDLFKHLRKRLKLIGINDFIELANSPRQIGDFRHTLSPHEFVAQVKSICNWVGALKQRRKKLQAGRFLSKELMDLTR